MPYRKQIVDGIIFLLSHKNDDDGIPATVLGNESGCWTTAEAVHVLLESPYFPKERLIDIRKMVEFLLRNQIPGKGWPMALEGNYVSTMATGHAIAALCLAEKVFHENEELVLKCRKAKAEGLDWIRQNRNPDEGWGVEPEKAVGKDTRIISTCYALKGYIASGLNYDNSKDIRNAVDYLSGIVNKDNGWGGKKGVPSDPDNTSRVVSILIQSGKAKFTDPVIEKAKDFILGSRSAWRWDTEAYASKGAPGQVIFHSNTPVDVLQALIECQYYGHETHDLIKFLIKAQEDDGRWYLSDQLNRKDTSNCTWCTSEAIDVLDFVQERYFEHLFDSHTIKLPRKLPIATRAVFGVISAIAILEFLQIINVYEDSYIWWINLSAGWQQSVFGVIVGTILTIVISIFLDGRRNKKKPLETNKSEK